MYYNLGYINARIAKLLDYKVNTISVRRLKIISRIRAYLYYKGMIDEGYLTNEEKEMAELYNRFTIAEVVSKYMLGEKHPGNEKLEKEKRLEELIKKDNLDDINKYLSSDEINTIFMLLKSNTLRGIFGNLSIEDFFIICLRFGFINGKSYTSEEIALFLNTDIEKVISLTKDILINYKKLLASNETTRSL